MLVVTLILQGWFSGSIAHAEDQLLYRTDVPTNGWAKSPMWTGSVRALTECAARCQLHGCVHFQHNDVTHTCALFSEKMGSQGVLDPSPVYTKDKCEWEKEATSKLYQDGWVVFMDRSDGSVDFHRPWADYRDGFGDPCGEFWLGLDTLSILTSSGSYKLRVEMRAWDGVEYFAEFSSFIVQSAATDYTLYVSGYDVNSTAGDSMTSHNQMMFTTLDADNDDRGEANCAELETGGWWFHDCSTSHPTGTYLAGGVEDWHGINYSSARGSFYSFQTMKLKFKKI